MTAADAKAALERGRPVVFVRPPAVEQVGDVWDMLGPVPTEHGPGIFPDVLIICADDASAAEWAAAPRPGAWRVHAVTGLNRSARLLSLGLVQALAGSVPELAVLVQRAALKLDRVSTVVVAWPEALIGDGDRAAALDTLLAEVRDARRVILSWNPSALGDFLERHARRAELIGAPAVDDSGALRPPVCRARYTIVPAFRRSVAVIDALDALASTTAFVWGGGPVTPPVQPPDAVVCTTLPTRDELAALARIGEPVLLLNAAQLSYARSIATLAALSVPSAADRARDRVESLREQVALRLAAGSVDAELALLSPLFERFDPAEVAAALLAMRGEREAVAEHQAEPERVKVFVNVGKRDRASAKDLVGALIREAGLTKGDIGRIDVRDSHSLVELAPTAAQQAVQRLAGATIRGRRVTPRLDRNT